MRWGGRKQAVIVLFTTHVWVLCGRH